MEKRGIPTKKVAGTACRDSLGVIGSGDLGVVQQQVRREARLPMRGGGCMRARRMPQRW